MLHYSIRRCGPWELAVLMPPHLVADLHAVLGESFKHRIHLVDRTPITLEQVLGNRVVLNGLVLLEKRSSCGNRKSWSQRHIF